MRTRSYLAVRAYVKDDGPRCSAGTHEDGQLRAARDGQREVVAHVRGEGGRGGADVARSIAAGVHAQVKRGAVTVGNEREVVLREHDREATVLCGADSGYSAVMRDVRSRL